MVYFLFVLSSLVEFMSTIVAPKFRYVLTGNEYDDSGEFKGPPRNVPRETVKKLFGAVCFSFP